MNASAKQEIARGYLEAAIDFLEVGTIEAETLISTTVDGCETESDEYRLHRILHAVREALIAALAYLVVDENSETGADHDGC